MTDDGNNSFPFGGGEMGALIRLRDWSDSGLGPVREWPQSLKTTVGILLHSPVPIVLLWGPDGIMIYNDAYSVFAGGRHPLLFGSKVREGWPEVADFNDNVMRAGLAGRTLSYRNQELKLYRTGAPEQVWMNLDYSPVLGENGRPVGVLAIVVETTQHVLAERALARTAERLRQALNASGMVGTFDWHVQSDTFYSDARFAEMFSVDPAKATKGAPLADSFTPTTINGLRKLSTTPSPRKRDMFRNTACSKRMGQSGGSRSGANACTTSTANRTALSVSW
jgi:PAS domain-containing protein